MPTAVTRRLAIAFVALTLTAGVVPSVRPEDVGLSSERLQRINDLVQRYIGSNQISGAVTVVSRKGKIAHFEAQGLMDIETRKPMAPNALFRILSMGHSQFAEYIGARGPNAVLAAGASATS